MSGRDWRRFVCEHRKQMAEPSGNRKGETDFKNSRGYIFQILDTLQTAFLSGSRRHVGFSVVDYDELLQSVQIEKEKGNSRAKRVKELACKGKKSREDAVLQEHKKAWFRGQEYLLSEVGLQMDTIVIVSTMIMIMLVLLYTANTMREYSRISLPCV